VRGLIGTSAVIDPCFTSRLDCAISNLLCDFVRALARENAVCAYTCIFCKSHLNFQP